MQAVQVPWGGCVLGGCAERRGSWWFVVVAMARANDEAVWETFSATEIFIENAAPDSTSSFDCHTDH